MRLNGEWQLVGRNRVCELRAVNPYPVQSEKTIKQEICECDEGYGY